MRFITFIAFIFFLSNESYAQDQRFNVFSVEVGGGIHAPYTPKNKINRSNYISFEQFQFAGRYMFNEKFGLKGQYAYHAFEDRKNSQKGAALHKFTLEAVYNLGKAFNLHYTIQEHFTFLIHAGGGVSVLTPKDGLTYERIGSLQFGLTPLIKISDRVAFYFDGTSVVNFKQHYSYGGELINSDYKDETGIFLTANAGFIFYLGDRRYHADWY